MAALAAVAGRGVHLPSEQPFLTPWTDGTPEDRARSVLRGHWGRLTDWAADNWALGMGIFAAAGEPLGMITLRATDFAVVREVKTTSWLGMQHQRQGFGTEARLGVLTLAFDHLGAEAALTEVFQDNAASQGVSRKLGYVSDGISRDARGAEALVSDRLRLWRSVWQEQDRPEGDSRRLARLCRLLRRLTGNGSAGSQRQHTHHWGRDKARSVDSDDAGA